MPAAVVIKVDIHTVYIIEGWKWWIFPGYGFEPKGLLYGRLLEKWIVSL